MNEAFRAKTHGLIALAGDGMNTRGVSYRWWRGWITHHAVPPRANPSSSLQNETRYKATFPWATRGVCRGKGASSAAPLRTSGGRTAAHAINNAQATRSQRIPTCKQNAVFIESSVLVSAPPPPLPSDRCVVHSSPSVSSVRCGFLLPSPRLRHWQSSDGEVIFWCRTCFASSRYRGEFIPDDETNELN